MRNFTLDVTRKADTTGVLFIVRIIKALLDGKSAGPRGVFLSVIIFVRSVDGLLLEESIRSVLRHGTGLNN